MRVIAGAATLLLFAVFINTQIAQAAEIKPSIGSSDFAISSDVERLIELLEATQKSVEGETLESEETSVEQNEEVDESEAEATSIADTDEPIKHTVVAGDSLSSISKEYDVYWKRIYNKNTKLKHPDTIIVGQVITIPLEEEKLKDRVVPKPAPVVTTSYSQPTTQSRTTTVTSTQYTVSRGSSSGNTYYAGYCTWYAKSRRPDLPNNLGNANTWVARAAAQGIPTGSSPRVGAIGQQGMHVVYVEAVHSNGTVTVSEMNFQGWNVVSRRTVPASFFQYIY